MIGLIVPTIAHAFFSEVTQGVQEVVESAGYSLLLCCSNRDANTELREIDNLVGSPVDGLIIASEQSEDCWQAFAQLQQEGIPFVLIDRFFPKFNCSRVITDDREAGRLATQHLIDLGHTRIGHIRGPAICPARLRFEGYLDAMKANGLKVNPDWTLVGSFRFGDSRQAMHRLLRLRERPTAVFAGNDPSAFGVVDACREAGFEIPRDISVVGAGNAEAGQYPIPFLTTVDWPRHKFGREAARILLEGISERPKQTAERVFAPQLLVRQSTGPLVKR